MIHRFRIPVLAVLTCTAAPLGAHPHVFVDVALDFAAAADGRIDAVEVTWSYDDFFSLLILEDMGLDPDGDAVLTDAELVELRGFDLVEWPDDFEGDLYLTAAGAPVEMGLPEATGIAVEAGRIVASHRRSVAPVAPASLRIAAYDPTFYVAYSLTGPVDLPGGCDATIAQADPEAAAAAVERETGRTVDPGSEAAFEVLEIGKFYADRAQVTCGAS